MELFDTVELMASGSYEDRFKAEYLQLKIRLEKLHKMIVKYEAGTLDFEPNTSLDVLKTQEKYMFYYLNTLEVRAQIEGIVL